MRAPNAFVSQRRSPATSAITGAPPTVKTSDFTMLPKGVPMLAAASSALRAVLASAITCASEPASVSAACTRRTAGCAIGSATPNSRPYGTPMPRCTAGLAPMVSNQRCRFG